MTTSRLPRCWHISSNRWNSAITEYALSAARAMALHGCPTLFSPLAGSPAESRAARCNLDLQPLTSFGLTGIAPFLKAKRGFAPDFIFVYGGPETTLSKLAGERSTVIRLRGQEIPRATALARLRHHVAHSHVGMIITPSSSLAERVRGFAGSTPVQPVTLGCDTAVFRRRATQTTPWRRQPDLVLLGRLDPIKGHEHVIGILRSVLTTWPEGRLRPRLHIVGEPANIGVDDLTRSVLQAGLSMGRDVQITARRVDDIATLMSEALIGVVPSLGSELICRVAEEFLLCGAPVLVSGAGSLDDVLFEGSGSASYRGLDDTGIANCFAAQIEQALSEDDRMRDARANRAKELFSLEAMGASLLAATATLPKNLIHLVPEPRPVNEFKL